MDQLVGTPGMVASLARVLMMGQFDIAREAAYAVCNIASNSQYVIPQLMNILYFYELMKTFITGILN